VALMYCQTRPFCHVQLRASVTDDDSLRFCGSSDALGFGVLPSPAIAASASSSCSHVICAHERLPLRKSTT
jgi:hypothetical protein